MVCDSLKCLLRGLNGECFHDMGPSSTTKIIRDKSVMSLSA